MGDDEIPVRLGQDGPVVGRVIRLAKDEEGLVFTAELDVYDAEKAAELRSMIGETMQIASAYDVPPWVMCDEPKPRFAWLRWKLRRVWPV